MATHTTIHPATLCLEVSSDSDRTRLVTFGELLSANAEDEHVLAKLAHLARAERRTIVFGGGAAPAVAIVLIGECSDGTGALRWHSPAAHDLLRRLHSVLESVQWAATEDLEEGGYRDACPWCECPRGEHERDCSVASNLREAELVLGIPPPSLRTTCDPLDLLCGLAPGHAGECQPKTAQGRPGREVAL